MHTIDIHLQETAPWRALLSQAQFASGFEFRREVEEYLVQALYRNAGMFVDIDPITPSTAPGTFEIAADRHDLRQIGDKCLLSAGLYPEYLVARNIPICYFVKLGEAAYLEYGRYTENPLYSELSLLFASIIDVLHALREVDGNGVAIDPINAFELWEETGSAHSWQILRQLTHALPGSARGHA